MTDNILFISYQTEMKMMVGPTIQITNSEVGVFFNFEYSIHPLTNLTHIVK